MTNKEINLEIWEKIARHPKLGEILVQHKKLKIYDIQHALEIQKKNNQPIGEILVQSGIISKNELVEVLELQEKIDKLLFESLNELEKLKNK